jgi:Fe-S-cluster containining protein
MSVGQNRRRRPKKIYRTVIKIKPGKDSSKPGGKPEIDIETTSLKPKLLKTRTAQRASIRKSILAAIEEDTNAKFKIAKRYDEELIQRMEWVPVTKKTRWKCIRCGWCCSQNWRVNLTWTEYDRLKKKLPIKEVVVDIETGLSHPLFSINGHCVQYNEKSHKCKIYKERAYSCATFPFSMTTDGKLVRSKFCKGFGKGDLVEKRKMIGHIYKWRKKAGMKI